jgi:lysylphosphatidylglycerol synthetase-like protein (DUF2156 family)
MSIPIQEIYLQGRNSQKEIVVKIQTVAILVEAYLTQIPNEKRTTKVSLDVMRLHDDLTSMLIVEAAAVAKEAEKRTNAVFKAESGDVE